MFENHLKEPIKDEIINKIALFCYTNIAKDALGKKNRTERKPGVTSLLENDTGRSDLKQVRRL